MIHTKIKLLSLISFFSFVVEIFVSNALSAKEGLVFACYDSSNGMPQNSAVAFDQNSDRFVYIATQEGLVKFDGLSFEVFDRKTLKGLPSNLIRDIKVIPDDNVFIATSKGMVLYDRKAGIIKNFKNTGGINNPDVTSIAYSTVRKKLFGILNSRVLFSYSGDEGVNVLATGEFPELKNLQKVFVTKSDDVFISGREGVFFLDKNEKIVKVEGINDTVRTFAENKEGYLFAGGTKGVYKVRNRKYIADLNEEVNSEIKNVTVLFFAQSRNTLFIGMAGSGLHSYSGNSLEKITSGNIINNGNIVSIFEDFESNLWVGTLSKGFCFSKKRRITETFLKNELVMGITEDLAGDLWVNSLGKGVARIKRKTGSVEHFQESYGNDVRSVFADSTGKIWVSARNRGIYILKSGEGFKEISKVFKSKEGGFPLNTTVFFEDSSGNIWFDNKDEQSKVYLFSGNILRPLNLPVKNAEVTDITENGGGSILVSTKENGVFRKNPQTDEFSEVNLYGKKFNIQTILNDSKNRLWMASDDKGVFVLSQGDIHNILEENGLYSERIHSMIEDNAGGFWFSTNKGLFSLKAKDAECFLSNECKRVSPGIYNESDGMPSAECNGGPKPSMIKSVDGTIWIPTVNGVAGINPVDKDENRIAPQIVLTGYVIDNDFTKKMRINDTENINLPKGSREIEIHYSAPVFKESSKVSFSYCLDSNCIAGSTKRRFATFNNLDPGEHKFRVRAFYEGESEENFSEKSIIFNIEPFFYETERFRSIFFIISFVSILLAFLMNKRSALIKEEEMRSIINSKTFKLELANSELNDAVMKDPLTGLRNRRYLYEVEEKIINEFIDMNAMVKERSCVTVFAVMMIDIDHFKRVNDYFGHATGDLVLTDFAKILKENTGPDDVVIRWGGEEFLVLIKGTTGETAVNTAENIRKSVEKHSFLTDDGKTFWLTCSIGLSQIPFYKKSPDFLSFDNIVSITDMALYYSKSSGRDRVTHVVSGKNRPLNQEQFQDMLISYDYAELNGFYKFEIVEKKNFEEFDI